MKTTVARGFIYSACLSKSVFIIKISNLLLSGRELNPDQLYRYVTVFVEDLGGGHYLGINEI
jgi:hypothetical protein